MDDDMFSGISDTKSSWIPKGTLIVPETVIEKTVETAASKIVERAMEAEKKLQAVNTKIGIFLVACLLSAVVLAYYFWWPKKALYAGKTLPGIGDATVMPQLEPLKEVIVKESPRVDPNIMRIDELLPLWPMDDLEDELPKDVPRVSETDASVLEMIRAREKATNELEAFQGLAKQVNLNTLATLT